MKKIIFLILIVISVIGLRINAKTNEDSLAIEKACRNYVEGWVEGNMDRVANGVLPELVKRTVIQDKEGMSFYPLFPNPLIGKEKNEKEIV